MLRFSPKVWLLVTAGGIAAASFVVVGRAIDLVRAVNAREDRNSRLREISEGIQRREVDEMSSMVHDLAARAPDLNTATPDSIRDFLSRMDGEMRITGTDMAFVLDSIGTVRLCRQDHTEKDLMGQPLAFRHYFREAKEGRPDLLGALGAYTRKRGIYASSPILDGRRFRGAVVTRLRAEEIERAWLSSQTDPVALITPEGVVIASNLGSWRLRHASSLGWTREKALASRQFGDTLLPLELDLSAEVANWQGQEWSVLRIPLPGGWNVVGLLPVSARKPLTSPQAGSALGLVAVWALLLLLGALVALGLKRIGRVERERGNLARRLDEAERLESLGRLAGGVAHDFNNVLTAIIGYSSVLEMRLSKQPSEQDMARRSGQAARRASETVKQLMAFARRSGLESKPVSMNDLVRELANLLEHTFPRSIRVELDLVSSRDVVVGDPNHLHQALLNLAVNARDAMPDGGVIRFVTSTVDSPSGLLLELRVVDTGSGIPVDVLPHVFEPFFTTKSGGRGTGLGLASVWGTVRRHGGTIAAICPEEGGTEFVIHLPLAPAGTDGPSVLPQALALPTAPSLRIVALDDDIHVLDALDTMSRSLGHTMEAYHDLVSLEHSLETGALPDLLILDLEMPVLPGTEVLRRLRRSHPHLTVLVASGHTSSSAVEEVRSLGVRVFLPKPFGATDLAKAIGEALRPPST